MFENPRLAKWILELRVRGEMWEAAPSRSAADVELPGSQQDSAVRWRGLLSVKVESAAGNKNPLSRKRPRDRLSTKAKLARNIKEALSLKRCRGRPSVN